MKFDGCSDHPLYKGVTHPWHAPFCEACARIWNGQKEVKALQDRARKTPQDKSTPWWLRLPEGASK